MGVFMSNTLKGVIVILALMAVTGFYLLKQNEAQFQAEFSSHQGLDSAISMGRIEVKSFEDWCMKQGLKDAELEACIQRRKAKAKKLLELEKEAKVVPSVVSPNEDHQALPDQELHP
jgi:hypothetical protein